jgi:hypothetical protein
MKLIKTFEAYNKSIYINPNRFDDMFVHILDLGFKKIKQSPQILRYNCPSCKGEGENTCKKCDGKGVINCKSCNNNGHVSCKKCQGEGVIDCCNKKLQNAISKSLEEKPTAKLEILSEKFVENEILIYELGGGSNYKISFMDYFLKDYKRNWISSSYVISLCSKAYSLYHERRDEEDRNSNDKKKSETDNQYSDEPNDMYDLYNRFRKNDTSSILQRERAELSSEISQEVNNISKKMVSEFKFCKKCKPFDNNGYRDCETCLGTGNILCAKCSGKSGRCKDCNGNGAISCKPCDGDGKVSGGNFSIRYTFQKNLDEYNHAANSNKRSELSSYRRTLSSLDDACELIEKDFKKFGYDSDFEFQVQHNGKMILLTFTISNIEDKNDIEKETTKSTRTSDDDFEEDYPNFDINDMIDDIENMIGN